MRLGLVAPELILATQCLMLVAVAGWARGRGRFVPALLATAGLAACAAVLFSRLGDPPATAFGGTFAVDPLATGFKLIVVAGALVSLAAMAGTLDDGLAVAGAPVALSFATLGAFGLLSANDLGLVVLFIQMMSMAAYVLIAATRRDALALEAALKYFVYAAVALAVMAYGLSFVYGLSGSLELGAVGRALAGADRPWVTLALVLVLAGFGFEIAMVPVHMWAPDALGGARGSIAGFVAAVPKVAGIGALIRFLGAALPGGLAGWPHGVAAAAVATMTFGNLAALRQTHLKRLLAYSSIAQAGYVLAAVAVAGRSGLGVAAAGLYLAAYTFMTLGVFVLAADLERSRGDDALSSLAGLARRQPWIAAAATLALLSLAGIPPLAGFSGKVAVLAALFQGHMAWLAAVAVINMVVGLAYYLRVVGAMVLEPDAGGPLLSSSPPILVATAACALGTAVLGVAPSLALDLFRPFITV